MTSLDHFTHLADRFAPMAVELAFQRMYAGVRFFDRHTLRPEYNPGHVRLALDIVKALRPHELLSGDEEKLLSNLDPRAFNGAEGTSQLPKSDVSPKLLTVKQLANSLSVSAEIIYRMVRENRIPHIQTGKKCLRFDPKEIQQWKEQRTMGPKLP